MRVAYRYIRPVTVIYARGTGRYETAAKEAWQKLSHWLAVHEARRQVKRAFGLFRDNPQITAPELLRYDACVDLTPGQDDETAGGICRQTLGGGTHAVHTHVGSYDSLGSLMSSRVHRNFA